jgi:hypothetical protein
MSKKTIIKLKEYGIEYGVGSKVKIFKTKSEMNEFVRNLDISDFRWDTDSYVNLIDGKAYSFGRVWVCKNGEDFYTEELYLLIEDKHYKG